jgi:peptidoglycan/xylan/chitin deacetylase (PgdA/CDA1 family)
VAGPELSAGPEPPVSGRPGSVPPILCYHKIDTRFELGFTQIEPRVFRRQVETLAAAGYRTLGSAELLKRLAAPAPPGQAPELVFTFDDGYAGLARHAFPILAAHGYCALVFVISDYVGRDNTWDVQYGWRRFAHLGWDDLARWQEQGIEVHSHGATHARLTWLSEAQAADELGRSRETIAKRMGQAPAGISYPFSSVNARVRALAEQAGYRLGFAGPSQRGRDALALPRRPVYGWDRSGMPLVLGGSALSGIGLGLARFTSRCAVGTAAIQRALGRRYGRARRPL